MKKAPIFAALALITASASPLTAQIDPVYLTGSMPVPNWAEPGQDPDGAGPLTAADVQLLDDGVAPDAAAGDGIYTLEISATDLALVAGTIYEYKVGNTWGSTAPNDNAKFVAPASGNVIFYYDSNTYGDQFVPDAGSGAATEGFVYTDLNAGLVAGATSIQATGNFQSALGGNNWDPSSTTNTITLTDAAAGTTGDDLYGGSVTGLPSGSYEFKVTLDGTFDPDFGAAGLATGGNLGFNVLSPSDTVTITLDAAKSRVKADNPSISAGPPFYAFCDQWSTAFGAATELNDNGDNTYRRTFNVAAAGDYFVKVRQGLGRGFPDSGDGCPFTTTAPNQNVTVIFDRNSYADGYEPASDFVIVVDASFNSLMGAMENVQPVGSWQSEFGSSDYNNSVSSMYAKDDGVGVDTLAADGIFSVQLQELDGVGVTGAEIKAVGERAGNTTDDGDRWNIQFGGPNNGLTVNGDNDKLILDIGASEMVVFKIDTYTGRIGAGIGSLADPVRTDYSVSSVQDWMLF